MIGTCKDQVALAKELEVMEKLGQLDTLVNRCNLSDRLICLETMESIAFEINNTISGTDLEQVECLDPGMLDFRKSIVEFTQEVAVMIPSAWLSFKIDLEKLSLNKYRSGIVPFEEVKSVALHLGINPEAALVYFHELGIFLWYHYSQTESLKKFVIVDPKKLLEVLASIFSPTGYSRYRSQWRDLKERGLLQKGLYKYLLSESKTGLPESWILEFLVEHHLAMCQDESYFIPSMLKIVTNIPDVSADQKASAIFIISNSKFTFECKCAEAGTRHFLPSLPWLSDGDVLCAAGESMKLEDRHKIWLKEKPSSMIGNVYGKRNLLKCTVHTLAILYHGLLL